VTGWNGIHCTLEGCPKSCSSHGTCKANAVSAYKTKYMRAYMYIKIHMNKYAHVRTYKTIKKSNTGSRYGSNEKGRKLS
jgi:hypothetical protein